MAAVLWLLIGCVAVLGLFVFTLARDLTKLRRQVTLERQIEEIAGIKPFRRQPG